MEIRRLEKREYPAAPALAWNVFLEFDAPYCTTAVAETFRRLISITSAHKPHLTVNPLQERLSPAGGRNHIAMFSAEYRWCGIEKSLLSLAFMDNSSGIITVNSSQCALQVCLRLCFRPTDSEELSDGVRFGHMDAELLDLVDENGTLS